MKKGGEKMSGLTSELQLISHAPVKMNVGARKTDHQKYGFDSILQQAKQKEDLPTPSVENKLNKIHNHAKKTSSETLKSKIQGTTESTKVKETDLGVEKDGDISTREKQLLEKIEKLLEDKELIEPDELEKLLGCSLEQWLRQMEQTIWDLMQPAQFQQFLQQILNIQDPMELLFNEKAIQVLKEVETDLIPLFAQGLSVEQKETMADTKVMESLPVSLLSVEESGVEELIENNGSQEQHFEIQNKTIDSDESVFSEKSNVTPNFTSLQTERSQVEETLPHVIMEGAQQSIANSISLGREQETQVSDDTMTSINAQRVDADELIQQITTHMKIHMKPDVSEISLQLKPEYLGNMSLKLVSEKGIVTGQIVVENQQVKEMVENQLYQLRQTLQEQGVKMDQVQVSLQHETLHQQQQQQQQQMNQQKSKRRVQQIIHNNMSIEDVDEPTKSQISPHELLYEEENQVDYSV